MTLDEEIRFMKTGKRVSLEYMKQFLKDYMEHGVEYVGKKFNIATSAGVMERRRIFTMTIFTYKNRSVYDVLQDMTDVQQLQFIKDYDRLGVYKICLKYKIRYNDTTISKWYNNLLDKFNLPRKKARDRNNYSDEDKAHIYEYSEANSRDDTIIYIMDKYDITRSCANILLNKTIERVSGKFIDKRTNKGIFGIDKLPKEQKEKLLDEITTKGRKWFMEEYGYTNIGSVDNLATKLRNDLNVVKEEVYTVEYMEEYINDYDKYGPLYVQRKYNQPTIGSVYNKAYKIRQKLA